MPTNLTETQDSQQKTPRPEAAKSTLPQPGRPVPSRAYPGALIVVEGTDGSGKSTQLYLLKRWLEIGGYRLHFTEWNSSPLVKSATRRGKQRRLLTPTTFFLLHAADFAAVVYLYSDAANSRNVLNHAFEHSAVKVEGCTACHTPHGSVNRMLMVRREERFL